MPYGFNSRILRVDLYRSKISVEDLDEVFIRTYLGGEGFVAYFLLKEVPSGSDPLGSRNKLVFAAGPVTGTPIPGSGRNSIGAKSPLTGGFGEAEVGGFWGSELKHAGFDAIIIENKSKEPVYLWVKNGKAELRDAAHLWGKDTGESQRLIRSELNDKGVRVALIGLGGENLVRYACVITELKDAAGRTGMGAVMGSKNLKAIAVRGKKRPIVADRSGLKRLRDWLTQDLDGLVGWAHNYGTGGSMDAGAKIGNLPILNFREGEFPNAESLDAKTIKETIRIRMEGCYGCPVRCKKIVKIDGLYTVDPIYGGPEYESLAALGSCCGIDDLKAVCKANEMCNRYSLDTISTGVTIAFAMECFEKGILTDKETEGLKLNFGNQKAMLHMVEKIANRQGLGNLLAEGSKRAAEKIGKNSDSFAVHVKGQEVPMHDPRLKRALGLGYAVSPTGADHMHNLHDMGLASNGKFMDDFASLGVLETIPLEHLGPNKVRALIYFVNWRVVNNCLLMCDFLPWNYIQRTEIVRAVTGWNTTSWELMKTGERVTTMARMFNVREGFTKKEDWLPDRLLNPPKSGALSSTIIDPKKLRHAIASYYQMMGWDEKGIPTKSKLEELGIRWVADIIT